MTWGTDNSAPDTMRAVVTAAIPGIGAIGAVMASVYFIILHPNSTDSLAEYGRTFQPMLQITEKEILPIFRQRQSSVPLSP